MAEADADLFSASAPSRVAREAGRVAGETVEEIEATLPGALAGERRQLRAYVSAHSELISRLLRAAVEARPDLVDERVPPSLLRTVLEQEAMSAPFSDWVGTLGPGRGTMMAAVSNLRAALPDAESLQPPPPKRWPPAWQLQEGDIIRFYRGVVEELSRTEAPLDHISSVLGVNRTELGSLFGVSRQAVEQWEARGVPAERREKLATLGEIADLLAAKVKRDRIPGVVRRSSPAYGGRSILEAIAAGDAERVLAELRDAFDWAVAA